MFVSDTLLPVVVSMNEKHIAQELDRLIAAEIETLDDSKIEEFVEAGIAKGLGEARALEIVAQLLNIHLENAEIQGRELTPGFDGTKLAELHSNPETRPNTAPQVVEDQSKHQAPIAYAPDTPPPRLTRIVRLGRPPILERPTRTAADEKLQNPDYTNSSEIEMRLVTSGNFIMGSDHADAPKSERPCTNATISRFYMSRFPITNLQFEKFDPDHARRRLPATGDKHPVVYVTSTEAIKFCEWLNRKEKGRRYRLPTEAEWEYAARGSTNRNYPWGDEKGISTVANFADARSSFSWRDELLDDGFPDTSPVGSFPEGTSPFRIEDMAGNVWEWCSDFYDSYRGGTRTNPHGPLVGVNRVIRGGSYKSRYFSLRAASRSFSLPTCATNDLGFRIVCDVA